MVEQGLGPDTVEDEEGKRDCKERKENQTEHKSDGNSSSESALSNPNMLGILSPVTVNLPNNGADIPLLALPLGPSRQHCVIYKEECDDIDSDWWMVEED